MDTAAILADLHAREIVPADAAWLATHNNCIYAPCLADAPRDRKSAFQQYIAPQSMSVDFKSYTDCGDGVMRRSVPGGPQVGPALFQMINDACGNDAFMLLADMTAMLMRMTTPGNSYADGCFALADMVFQLAIQRTDAGLATALVLTQDVPTWTTKTKDAKIVRKKRYANSKAKTGWHALEFIQQLAIDDARRVAGMSVFSSSTKTAPVPDAMTFNDFENLFAKGRSRAALIAEGTRIMIERLEDQMRTRNTPVNLIIVAECFSVAHDRLHTRALVLGGESREYEFGLDRPVEGEFSAAAGYGMVQTFIHEVGHEPAIAAFGPNVCHAAFLLTIDTDLVIVGIGMRIHALLDTKRVHRTAAIMPILWGAGAYDTRLFDLSRVLGPIWDDPEALLRLLFAYGAVANDYVPDFGNATSAAAYSFLSSAALSAPLLRPGVELCDAIATPAAFEAAINPAMVDELMKAVCIAGTNNSHRAALRSRALATQAIRAGRTSTKHRDAPYTARDGGDALLFPVGVCSWDDIAQTVAACTRDPTGRVPTPDNRAIIHKNIAYAVLRWLFDSAWRAGDELINPFSYGYTVSALWIQRHVPPERNTSFFTMDELDEFAAQGAWIVPQTVPLTPETIRELQRNTIVQHFT